MGFDWEHAHEVLAKVREETEEVEQELAAGPAGSWSANLAPARVGDLLFAVVNLARKLRSTPSWLCAGRLCVSGSGWRAPPGRPAADGLDFEGMGLEEQEAYYQRAKKEQRDDDRDTRSVLDARSSIPAAIPPWRWTSSWPAGRWGRAAVPSGASTGSFEAVELRDGGEAYRGQGRPQCGGLTSTKRSATC